MATDWTAVENAIHQTVATAASMATIWTAQETVQPSSDYLTLQRSGPGGSNWTEVVTQTTDLGQPAGSEVEIRVSVHSEFTVRVQAFTATTTKSTAAASVLGALRLKLRLQSARASLAAAGLVLVSVDAVRDLAAIAGTRWQGRAAMELRFRMVETEAERVGYIATAEVTTTLE